MHVNETYCGGHFTVSTNAGSLHYKPETNVTCQFYLNRKKKKDPTDREEGERNLGWVQDY